MNVHKGDEMSVHAAAEAWVRRLPIAFRGLTDVRLAGASGAADVSLILCKTVDTAS